LLFLMIFQFDFKSGLLLESANQLRVNNDVGDVALFKLDTVGLELLVEVVHHCIGHV
jgi:hypothetical protein